MHGYIYSSILLNQEKVLTSLCQGYMCLSILLKRECILGMFRSMIDPLFARTRVYTFLILCFDFVERKSQKRKIRKNPGICDKIKILEIQAKSEYRSCTPITRRQRDLLEDSISKILDAFSTRWNNSSDACRLDRADSEKKRGSRGADLNAGQKNTSRNERTMGTKEKGRREGSTEGRKRIVFQQTVSAVRRVQFPSNQRFCAGYPDVA